MRIPRNTTIPVTRTERFHTVYPGQTAVSIEIYQGEHERVKYNHSLREFLLEGIPAIHQQGAIVNLGSIAGQTGLGSSLPYAVSKAAVHGLTKSLARTLAPNIRVNCVVPGAVKIIKTIHLCERTA